MLDNLAAQYKYECVWDDNTIYLYFFIVIFTYLISTIRITTTSQYVVNGHYHSERKRNYIGLLLSFILIFIIAAFRDIGADLSMYRMIYLRSLNDWESSAGMEPGFLLLNAIIRFSGLNEYWGIGIISFISYYLVYKTIYVNRKFVNVGLSVLAFTALYYLQSFNLVRIYLAAAFLLYTSKYLFKLEYKKYAICVLIAIAIHYSSCLMLVPLFLFFIFTHKRKYFYTAFIATCVIIYFATSIIDSIPVFSRYERYVADGTKDTNIGFMHFFINVPIFLLYFYARHKKIKSTYLSVLWVYSLMSLTFGVLSYKILMFGRSLVYFNILFILCIPYVINRLKRQHDQFYKLIYSSYVIYLIFRFIVYLYSFLTSDGIMPYHMIEFS